MHIQLNGEKSTTTLNNSNLFETVPNLKKKLITICRIVKPQHRLTVLI